MEGLKRSSDSVTVSPTPNAKKARDRRESGGASESSSTSGFGSSSQSLKTKNADLVDHGVNRRPWGWKVSFCERALLARLKVMVNKDKTDFMNNFEQIKAVKYFSRLTTKEPVKVEEYQCLQQRSIEPSLMMKHIVDASPHFHEDVTLINLDSPLWKQVNVELQALGLKYIPRVSYDGKVGWRTSTVEDASGDQTAEQARGGAYDLVTSFEEALLSDMTNGEGKDFFLDLTEFIKKDLDFNFFRCRVTSQYYHSNTKIEMVAPEDTTNWDRAYSTEPPEPIILPHLADAESDVPSSDMSTQWQESDMSTQWQEKPVRTLAVREASTVVPDLIWFLADFPGQFPLVVEVKPDKVSLADGITQCYKQMLAKFYFQDSIFGLLITPRDYSLLFAHKSESKDIDLYVQTPISFGEGRENWDFNSGGFFQLVETLAKIMDWAGRISGKH